MLHKNGFNIRKIDKDYNIISSFSDYETLIKRFMPMDIRNKHHARILLLDKYNNIGNNFNDTYATCEYGHTDITLKSVDYILIDQFGRVININDVINDVVELIFSGYEHPVEPFHYITVPKYVKYRYDPVPNTGRNRWRSRNFYNYPKTTSELRAIFGNEEYVRGKRRKRYLPTSWDRKKRSDQGNNWKLYRKNQYKIKGI